MMTKKQAENQFKLIINSEFKNLDKYAQRLEWDFFIDSLCKSGQITNRQYATWCRPKFIK